jgi:hypothetical protein
MPCTQVDLSGTLVKQKEAQVNKKIQVAFIDVRRLARQAGALAPDGRPERSTAMYPLGPLRSWPFAPV